jgi:PAS domain S-box-containing protein
MLSLCSQLARSQVLSFWGVAMTESKDMSGDLSRHRESGEHAEKPSQKLPSFRLNSEESLRLHAELFERAPVGYFVFNRKGLLEKVNEAGARMLGHDKTAIESKPILNCFAKTSYPKFFEHIAGVSVMRRKQACHLELIRADGTTFKAHFVTSPINDAAGGFVHFRTIVVDISGRR